MFKNNIKNCLFALAIIAQAPGNNQGNNPNNNQGSGVPAKYDATPQFDAPLDTGTIPNAGINNADNNTSLDVLMNERQRERLLEDKEAKIAQNQTNHQWQSRR